MFHERDTRPAATSQWGAAKLTRPYTRINMRLGVLLAVVVASVLTTISVVADGPTVLVSVNREGTGGGNNYSTPVAVSANNRYVTFNSLATDLVEESDTNRDTDVFIRDLHTGTTRLVSINQAGTATGTTTSIGGSGGGAMSADGRYVAFGSSAIDLTPGDINLFPDAFVRDMQEGTTQLVSVNLAGTSSCDSGASAASISADGRYVAFVSGATDLVEGGVRRPNVYVRDLREGTTILVSVNKEGTGAGNSGSEGSAISIDGRYVAFTSLSSDLVEGDTNGRDDVFVRDLQRGTTQLVSINSAGTGSSNFGSTGGAMSADGRYIAFTSAATDLVEGVAIRSGNIYVRDMQEGTTRLVSINPEGTGSGDRSSAAASISADGRYVAFTSFSTNLLEADLPSAQNVYIRDLLTGELRLVNVNIAGTGGSNREAYVPVLSPDGQHVAFFSSATDLVEGDVVRRGNVFIRQVNFAPPPQPAAQVQFSTANYRIREDGGTATITVTRTGDTSRVATVDYATADDTAVAGTDYVATSGTLSFAAGETEQTFTVTILADAEVEDREQIVMTLANAAGASLGKPSCATLTVRRSRRR